MMLRDSYGILPAYIFRANVHCTSLFECVCVCVLCVLSCKCEQLPFGHRFHGNFTVHLAALFALAVAAAIELIMMMMMLFFST